MINGLNKTFGSRVRLGIMSVLTVNDTADFNALKEYLELSDGNLATHIKALEKDGIIETKKSFIGRKPNTKYSITAFGKVSFAAHLNELEKIIQSQK